MEEVISSFVKMIIGSIIGNIINIIYKEIKVKVSKPKGKHTKRRP